MKKKYIRCWLKYRHHISQGRGPVVHKNQYTTERERKSIIERFRRKIKELDDKGQIWQARIYDTEGSDALYVHKSNWQEYESAKD